MSLKRNILANYVSQIYVTIIGIVMVPLYIKYMGAEAYGLVGFFAMLQAWFNLLDMGLTPTMARETARFRGGATDALSYRRLVRALEGVFLAAALTGGIAMFAAAGYIAHDWLQASQLPITEVQRAVQLMAAVVALRWMCGLYRGAISGSERLVWLGGYNAFVATLRFIGVLAVLIFIGATPTIFFSYQLGVAVLELAVLLFQVYRLLPIIPQGMRLPWAWTPLKPVLKFSFGIAFAALVGVLVTQTDKLLLSNLLPLDDYGHFTLAVLVASGVAIISGPISGAIMPRIATLEAEGEHAGLIHIYRQSTQLVAVISGAVSITVAFCAESLLWAWTGDKILAHQAAPILILYAIGNGIFAVSAFPYYLQYAKGDLRLHLIGNALFAMFLIPSIIWATSQYGAVGAGWTWLALNLLNLLFWVPIVHKRFVPGLHTQWLLRDVGMPILLAAFASALLFSVINWPQERLYVAIRICMAGLVILATAATGSSWMRAKVSKSIRLQITKYRNVVDRLTN